MIQYTYSVNGGIKVTKESKGKLYILMAAVLWSIGGVLIKVIPWSAFGIIGTRSLLSVIVLCLYRGFNKKIKLNKIILFAGISASLTNILFVYATKMTTSANAIVLQSTAPIFVMILSVLFLHKKIDFKQVLMISTSFIGILIFFMENMSGGALIGNILAVLSGIAYAGMYFFNSFDGADPLDSSILAHAINVLVALPTILQFNEPSLSMAGVYAIIALGVVQIGFPYILFSKGIVLCDGVSASLISMAEAVLNPIWVAIFINEIPSLYSLIGGTIVLLSVVFNIIKKD